MAELGFLIPIVLITSIVAIVGVVMHYRTARASIEAEGGKEYRRLAEESVRTQRAVLEEVQKMNASLREIERLLREV